MRLVYGWAPDSRLASSGEGSGAPAAREPSAETWEKGEERRRRRGVGGAVEGEGKRWKERRRRRDRWGRRGQGEGEKGTGAGGEGGGKWSGQMYIHTDQVDCNVLWQRMTVKWHAPAILTENYSTTHVHVHKYCGCNKGSNNNSLIVQCVHVRMHGKGHFTEHNGCTRPLQDTIITTMCCHGKWINLNL